MVRLPLALACVASIACASSPVREPAKEAPTPSPAPPRAIPGFERQPGERVVALDVTDDGKPDVWTYTLGSEGAKEVLLRKERDLNADGRIDTWERYDADGAVARLVHDLDFDGRPDVTLFYEKGQLVKKELAFGFEGVPRTRSHYEKGRLVRKERDMNSDGKVDYWEYWENGELDRIGVDRDGDGKVDRWESRRTTGAPVTDQK